jgi:glycosyltransferase involved in cell wall biosynthesis
MDVVVNAHSGASYDALKWRADHNPWDHHSAELAYLHVVDDEPHAIRQGWPMIAARLEPYIDAYVVISDAIAATVRTEGVPGRKLVHGPNAPVVRPSSRAVAHRLADEKADRLARGGTLRILIAGRLDYQKGGGRATAAVETLVARGRDVHVSVLGEPTLDAEVPQFPTGVCTWLGATSDARELASQFAAADALLLLSRWEGVPLAMLDAMVHGVVVIATDVGAIGEVAHDRHNALVIDQAGTDVEIGIAAATAIEELFADADLDRAMRRSGVDTAWTMSWDQTANAILSFLPADHGGPS